jgi:hypothetical protein
MRERERESKNRAKLPKGGRDGAGKNLEAFTTLWPIYDNSKTPEHFYQYPKPTFLAPASAGEGKQRAQGGIRN